MTGLTFTESAKRRILELCKTVRRRSGPGVIPAVMWIDKVWNPDVPKSGVTIGFYNEDQRAALGACVVTFDGFEYVLAVGQEDESRFLGKTLNHRDGSFHLD